MTGPGKPFWSYKVIIVAASADPGFLWEGPSYVTKLAFISTGPEADQLKS